MIPYIACGDPYADATVDIMLALAAGGADVIELGVPFSDPMADGPVIQKASERALARGIGTPQVLEAVRGFRARDARTPIVLMGYANPIEAYDLAHGAGGFVRACAEAGVDGVLVVDYPPEESLAFSARAEGGRAGADLPAGAHLDRGAHEAGGRGRGRLRLLRVAEGRHGRRPPRHRGRGTRRAADPGST